MRLDPEKSTPVMSDNGFNLNWDGETDIVQNFNTSSTDMLLKIDTPQDLLFVDGSTIRWGR